MTHIPEQPHKYDKPQCILNSGRLLLNAREDFILGFAKKGIAFSTQGSVHFDSDDFHIINAPKIYLGLKKGNQYPDEPLLLGNKTEKWLNELLNNLQSLSVSLSKLTGKKDGVPQVEVNMAASLLNNTIIKLKNELPLLKSNQNFTI